MSKVYENLIQIALHQTIDADEYNHALKEELPSLSDHYFKPIAF